MDLKAVEEVDTEFIEKIYRDTIYVLMVNHREFYNRLKERIRNDMHFDKQGHLESKYDIEILTDEYKKYKEAGGESINLLELLDNNTKNWEAIQLSIKDMAERYANES